MIGKYAAKNGPTNAAKHYTAVRGIKINESTASRFKEKYLKKLKEILEQNKKQQVAESKKASDSEEYKEEHIIITELETKPRGRPLLLGDQLDLLVKEFINVTRPAKTGHVGTIYTPSLYRSYLSTGIVYLHSVTCIMMPLKCLLRAENCNAIA